MSARPQLSASVGDCEQLHGFKVGASAAVGIRQRPHLSAFGRCDYCRRVRRIYSTPDSAAASGRTARRLRCAQRLPGALAFPRQYVL